MALNPSSPITGGAQTGFTSPTYTLTTDQAPNNNSKQYAVTALGGTQANVDVHSASKPFTLTFFRPQTIKTLGQANPITGIVKNIPSNTYKVKVRKGVTPAANQATQVSEMTLSWSVPAGADSYEPEDLRAQCSLMIGALNQLSASIGDLGVTGLM